MKNIHIIPIEQNFIKTFTDYFFNKDERDFSKIAVVFPNRRPFLYLNKYLSLTAKKPLFAPREFTISKFIEFLARKKYPDFKLINYIDSVWILFNIIKETGIILSEEPGRIKSFEEFFPWGVKILKFINQIDIENINNKILENLEENARIGFEIPQIINSLFQSMVNIRNKFHKKLEQEKMFTKGLYYIKAYEILNDMELNEFDKIYFAGLFALTNIEKAVIKSLIEANKADLIWNAHPDNWPGILLPLMNYFNIRQSDLNIIHKQDTSEKNDIKIYSSFDTHSMVTKVYDVLKHNEVTDTMIVLPNADTLSPLLSFVVENLHKDNKIKKFNISMGFPLNRSSLFSLVKKIIDLQKNTYVQDNQVFYNTRQYADFISHPFIKNLQHNDNLIRHISYQVHKAFKGELKHTTLKGQSFLSLKMIESDNILIQSIKKSSGADEVMVKQSIQSFHKKFLKDIEEVKTLNQFCSTIQQIIDFIFSNTRIRSYILSGEVFNQLFKSITEILKTRITHEELDRNLIFSIFSSYIDTQSIPFETKPLQELEIVGMLETRNLNFKNIIILDVQEGIMPAEKMIDPLIPIDLYKIVGLPDDIQFQEMYRYYFERLIKSTRNVKLFYIQNEDKQRSRYIEKIIWEHEYAAGKLDVLPVEKTVFPVQLKQVPLKEISIKKNALVMKKLGEMSFSPSSIDTYLECRLKFYFKNILYLDKPGEIAETIDPRDRGTLIHNILKDTFSPFLKKTLNRNNHAEIKENLDKMINKHFALQPQTGEYYILRKITQYRLNDFIRLSLNWYDKFTIMHLEGKYKADFKTEKNNITLSGKIDRIDKVMGKYIIMDYKTGSDFKPDKINFEIDFNNIEEIKENIISFQLPIYVLLLLNNKKGIEIKDIEAKYIRLIHNLYETLFPEDGKNNYSKEEIYNDYYIRALKTVIDDILNPDREFKKFNTTDCAFCAYTQLCGETPKQR